MKPQLFRRDFLQTLVGLGTTSGLIGCGGGNSSDQAGLQPAPAPTPAPVPEPTPAPAPPLQLNAANWTPNRDSQGLVLSTDWAQLPLLTWLNVPGSVLDTVIEHPRYPKPNASSGDGSPSIISAWGGAAWDPRSQSMYISGGGHGDAHGCETGVYALDAASLSFKRVVDRAPLSTVQSWDFTLQKAVPLAKGNASNMPLTHGVPSSIHTYDGLVWLPPGLPGTGPKRGGLFYPGNARTIINLDTAEYASTHWFAPPRNTGNWSYCTAFLDGSSVYGPHDSFAHFKFDLTRTEATDWNAASLGHMSYNAFRSSTEFPYANRTWLQLEERREQVAIFGNAAGLRVKYGAAIDANATDWSSFHEPITLSSSDGSHLDFNRTHLTDDGMLSNAGVHYDHESACIWLQANTQGGALYRLDGVHTDTWTVSKQKSVAALWSSPHGTWGRFRVARFRSAHIALRVSGTTHPLQILRLR
jgi:hypothetical protein